MCLLGSSGLKPAMLKQITNKTKRTEKGLVREMVRAINWDLQLCCSIVPLLLRILEFAPHTRKIKGVPSVYRYFPFVGLGDFYLKELKLMAWYQKYSRVSLQACWSTVKFQCSVRSMNAPAYPGQASLRGPVTGKRVSVFFHSSDHRPVRKYWELMRVNLSEKNRQKVFMLQRKKHFLIPLSSIKKKTNTTMLRKYAHWIKTGINDLKNDS